MRTEAATVLSRVRSRRIAVITSSRADFGLLYWTLRAIQEAPDLELDLLVTGAHLSPEFGLTIRDIENEEFQIGARIEMLLSSDSGIGTAKGMGLGLLGFAEILGVHQPDLLLVLGDRFETFAAVAAAMPLHIPVGHIHGGELTQGVIDDLMRHAITKMSHLHFTATEAYADRIRQMGEEPWRIVVSGAPGVEAIRRTPRTPLEELRTQLDISLDGPSLLVTYHPVPGDAAGRQPGIESLLKALEAVDAEILFTYPNADAGGRAVIEAIQAFVASHGRSRLFVNLGQPAFFTLMANVSSMVGNSSSGLLEAPSFELPVVNIGDRQRGRIRAANVIDADSTVDGIVAGIQQALDPAFRRGLGGLRNPYGTGEASAIIVSTLRSAQLGPNLLCKAFVTT